MPFNRHVIAALWLVGLTASAHAAPIINAHDIHLCVNLHDSDAAQAVSAMKTAGFSCYRKDSTGNPIEAALASAGDVGDFIVSSGPQTTGQLAAISALAKSHPGSVQFVEGPNEVNNHQTVYGGFSDTTGGDQSNRSAVHLYDRDLLANVRADPNLAGVPLLAHTDIHASWGPADWANVHLYDGSTDSFPDYWPSQGVKEMTAAMAGAPMALTEFGSDHADREARLLPQWIAAALQAGIDRMWLYELRDQPGDAYGLFNADWSQKTAVPVIAELNTLLADSGPYFTPASLNVTVSDAGINSVLIGKSDGSYVNLLWRSWPTGAAQPLQWSYDRSMHVTAHALASTAAGSGLFDVTWSKGVAQLSDWNSYTDGVLVLEVRP